LVRLAHCSECHTPGPVYRLIEGLEFGGGEQAEVAGASAACANITPDPSGISYWDEAQFLKAIRTGKVGARKLSSMMPWWFFGHMTDDDLKAIFAYLRTLKPVHHRVDNTEPIAWCKICRQKHAGGALNY
jgi:mono/diheme cytochrome c family protein